MIRRSTTESLAARAAASGDIAGINSAALTEKAHFHRLKNMYPNISDMWDFRHSRNRPTALAAGTQFLNLVLGRDPAVVERSAGLTLTANALRFTGAGASITPLIKLPNSARPEPGMKQYGFLLMGNIIAKSGTFAHGLLGWGATTTTGITVTLPFTASATGNFGSRFNNANIGGVYNESFNSPVYPVATQAATYTVGTPFMLGHGWEGGTENLGTKRWTTLNEKFGRQISTTDGTFSGEAIDNPFYVGGNNSNNNTGLVFDVFGIAIVKWMASQGEPPADVREVWRDAYWMMGLDLLTGYVPPAP
jgi:hypothetical protein